jgi:hypothetical protein
MRSRFGVVNKQGEIIVPPTLQTKINFDQIRRIGLTTVLQNKNYGVLNADMELITYIKYDQIKFVEFNDETFVLLFRGKFIDLFDSKGNQLSSAFRNYIKWKQNPDSSLSLFDGISWYNLGTNREWKKLRLN